MFTTRPVIAGTFGVVSSTHWLASSSAMAVLEKGGNAFDAAVAAGLVLLVVEPHMNGLGGDAVLIACGADQAQPQVLCGQGVAPRRATISHYRSLGLDIVPGTGLLAAVVPGAFGAWLRLLRDRGTMRLGEVLAPAITYAEAGHPMLAGVSQAIDSMAEIFSAEWPGSAEVYLQNGRAPAPGSLFRSPTLAATFRRILSEAETATSDRDGQIEAARRAFYEGFVAEAIGRFVDRAEVLDSTGQRNRGVITADDLAAWRAEWEAPIERTYRNYTVFKAGPWTQGPVLLQTLALLEGFDIAGMDPLGVEFVHTVVECMKLAFADREAYYGDPLFADVPIAPLLSRDYNDRRRRLVGDTASAALRPGALSGVTPRLPTQAGATAGAVGTGEPSRVERERARAAGTGSANWANPAARGPREGDTCHIDVIDRHGNMVAATPSGGWLQSSPVIPGLGLCLGTRAQMFWLEGGLPASLAPGKRPRTTLTPSLAFRDGRPYMAFGTPGGDGQDQWTLQFFLRHVDHHLDLQAAIDAPMWQSDHAASSFYPRTAMPNQLVLEERFPAATIAGLVKRGHGVTLSDPWSLGRNCAAVRDGGILKAAATPRLMQAYAVGR